MAQPNQPTRSNPTPVDFIPDREFNPDPNFNPEGSYDELEPVDKKAIDPNFKEPNKFTMIDDVSFLFKDDGDKDYPYDQLKLEQAFFVPTQPNDTTDKLLIKIHKSIEVAKRYYGEIEVNEEGDEILEVLTIRTKQLNQDGTVKLVEGKPVFGADFHQRPKYIYTRNFIAKPVTKGQKLADGVEAEGDGVVVVRVA